MPDIIKVSTSKLTSTANSFQATGNQIKSITNQMTTLVNSLNGKNLQTDHDDFGRGRCKTDRSGRPGI